MLLALFLLLSFLCMAIYTSYGLVGFSLFHLLFYLVDMLMW